jgi:hypothetical protein
MYGQVKSTVTPAAGAGAGGAFAFTDASSWPWLIIASLTLLAVGFALLRLLPKRER